MGSLLIIRNRLSLLVVLALLPVSSSLATKPAVNTPETKKARELFAAAQRLYEQKRFAEAIEKFEAAYAAKPHPVIHYNIGRCYEELGQVGPAVKEYKTYLRLSPEARDRDQVADTIAVLERKLRGQGLQQLTIAVEPQGAVIEVDGKVIGQSPVTVEVTIGTHHLGASLDGYEPFGRSVSVAPGQASELNVSLLKREPKLDEASSKGPLVQPTAGVAKPARASQHWWIPAVGAAVLASVGVTFVFVAKGTAAPLLTSPSLTLSEARSLRDQANFQQSVGLGCFLAAAAAAVASAVLGVLSVAEAPRPVVALSPLGISVGFAGVLP